MKLSDFDYTLPETCIALYPAQERENSRLLKLDLGSGDVSHHVFSDLPDLLRPSDLLVLNNTKVFPARLLGRRLGLTSGHRGKRSPLRSQIEVLLVKPLEKDFWEVLVKPGRKIRVGEVIAFGNGELQCEVLDRGDFGVRKVRFQCQGDFDVLVDQWGHVPLPPYLHRPDEALDRLRYQTVYASQRGAVAAPTAGLHFSEGIFARLREKGIEWCEVTLHVGLATFQPVHSETVENHQMEKEHYEISEPTAAIIRLARSQGRRVIAVGTTTTRTLESAALQFGPSSTSCQGETDLFIYPGFEFRCISGLITNFHLPRSTLLMLVSAFAGRDQVLKAYQEAIQTGYRFYSYGDCMLIL
jgi:S-adenosylmethionine:tRNA ribosyltransferase-isomerase